jgi:hypothetical protein
MNPNELINREYNWYKIALTYFEKHPEFNQFTDGVCKALKNSGVDLTEDKYMYTPNKILLHTLYLLNTVDGLWWFDTREERIEALKKSIALCIKKRELVWLRMAREGFKNGGQARGVCGMLYDCGINFDYYYDYNCPFNENLLPTLYSLKTKDSSYWFGEQEERLTALDNAIALLEKEFPFL